ncbi:unnamed protein product [Camellia sinensis]
MSSALLRILLALLFFSSIPQKSDGQFEDWCIADEQTPDDELQKALDWACRNGADCSKIQEKQHCYLPNTLKDHASFAFNSYYQKMKNKGGSCYFNAAAIITDLDPRDVMGRAVHVLIKCKPMCDFLLLKSLLSDGISSLAKLRPRKRNFFCWHKSWFMQI